MSPKVGKKLSKRCKWDREWQVHECGYSHTSVYLGSLTAANVTTPTLYAPAVSIRQIGAFGIAEPRLRRGI